MIKPKFNIIFFTEDSGKEPVRIWIKKLNKSERIIVGEDLKTLQRRWPLGLPLIDNLRNGLWELRSTLFNRICRIIFIVKDDEIVLLHAFIKKTQKTPLNEIEIADRRRKKYNEITH